MATAITGSFFLTEAIQLTAAAPSGTRVQGEIDLGAYVNVATGQAVAIDQVDFIFQVGADFGYEFNRLSSFRPKPWNLVSSSR